MGSGTVFRRTSVRPLSKAYAGGQVTNLKCFILFFYLFDTHFTQFQLMYITGSETIANINNDTKASNESTNRHRIAIYYTGYSEGSALL